MEQESISMEVVNPQAAGIDVGSRSHWVAVGQSQPDVREYGVFNQDLFAMAERLKKKGIKKFKTAKHFASWLRLAPNNKVSGGKLLSSKVPKGSNRLKIALRNAANAIGNLKESTPLRDFFQRISSRKRRVSAISATARKLAVIIWNMVVKGTPYVNPEGYLFLDQKRKLGLV
ncbi:transposase, partial [Algoriphagus boritolerans]